MLSVRATAQLAAMEGDGAETVDSDLIRKVYREGVTPLHTAFRILRSGGLPSGLPQLTNGSEGMTDAGSVAISPNPAKDGVREVRGRHAKIGNDSMKPHSQP